MKIHLLPLLLACSLTAQAQTGIGAPYDEAADTYAYDRSAWSHLSAGLYASWSPVDVHPLKHEVPALRLTADTTLAAWRGERTGAFALLYSRTDEGTLALRLGSLRTASGTELPAQTATARFVRYVLSDDYHECGTNPRTAITRLRPDVIDVDAPLPLAAEEVRPVWVTVDVPREAAAGLYTAPLQIVDAASGDVRWTLFLHVRVLDRTLPAPADQQFVFDFWQQPFSVARYMGVEKWSAAHFDALRPYMEMLRRAGQKTLTVTLFHEPWGEQSNDLHDAMVRTTHCADGTWSYDYTLFDRWVEFGAECGIDRQINCYSMIPWNKTFRFFDEALQRDTDLVCEVGSPDYDDLWSHFLTAFAAHLREKGWLEKTCIAMDERGLDDMLKAYALLQRTVPGMKMALAGTYHTELVDKLHDYSLTASQRFPADVLASRRAAGQLSTSYYCCTEARPNIFTNSEPGEAPYLPLYAAAHGFDGILHWSFIDWTDHPLLDSRFRRFEPGDTYLVYPGGRSSVRYERLVEGIQAAEKLRLVRHQAEAHGNKALLQRLDAALAGFSAHAPSSADAIAAARRLEALLNE